MRFGWKAAGLILLVGMAACGGPESREQQISETQPTARMSPYPTIPVGKGPDALFLTPDERFLYVANVEDTFLSVIDTRKDAVVTTIDGVNYPWGFARLNGTNLVAVSGWDKGIDIVDFTRHEIVRQKRYAHNLGGIVAGGDGKFLYVVATEANKVLKVDAGSLEIVDEYPTGNGPDGIGISADDAKIYVTNTKDGTISVIRLDDKSSQTISTGGKPELVHANHDRTRL
ncbi:MAG: YncE family protein, partial [Calditrichaeota bacterium]